jgi:hypothetical protein
MNSKTVTSSFTRRISFNSLNLTSKKEMIETWTFQSVILYIHKQILQFPSSSTASSSSSHTLRVSYMRVLGHVSTALLEIASTDDFEWIINSMLEVLIIHYIYISISLINLIYNTHYIYIDFTYQSNLYIDIYIALHSISTRCCFISTLPSFYILDTSLALL